MSLFHDPAHWRTRAEEMRRLAQATPELGTRLLLEVVAKSYDELADRAEARAKDAPNQALW